MKNLGTRIIAMAVICVAAVTCFASTATTNLSYKLADVVVTSYNLKTQTISIAHGDTNRRVQTGRAAFFMMCDGSIRRISELQASKLTQNGARANVTLVKKGDHFVMTKALLIAADH